MEASPSQISAVEFRVQSDESRRRSSRTPVRSSDLFAGETPVPKGLYDPHMGSTDPRYSCGSCGLGSKACPGHPGHVDLPFPVLLPYMVAEARRWLRVACLACGALVVDTDNPRVARTPAAARLAQASILKHEGVECPACRAPHPKISKYLHDHFSLQVERPGERPRNLYPYELEQVFGRISDASVRALGRDPRVAHPRLLVMRVLQVPPVSIRPGIRMSGPAGHGSSCHDINSILQYIVKAAATAPAWAPAPGAVPPEAVHDSMVNLQQLVFNLIVGGGAAGAQRSGGKRDMMVSGRPAMSLTRRWPGKRGRLRRNGLGTRVWDISRNTISGSCSLSPEDVGIPESFARALQVEEVVQPENAGYLMQFFLNGRRQYPGASRVRRAATGTLHDVEGLLRTGQVLEVGDRLWRDVVTGDRAFFNRAPSLERSSIGMHRVVVLRRAEGGDSGEGPRFAPLEMKSTVLNVITTPMYNADFDGDEMNLWIAAQPGARAEGLVLSSVDRAFISTKSSLPVMGMVQDGTVGACLLSLVPAMGKLYAMSLLENLGLPPPDLSGLGAGTLSGRELISLLLEKFPVSLERRPAWYSDLAAPYMQFAPADTHTRIVRGRLVSGVLDKATVSGGAGGGVFHRISRSYSPRDALRAMAALQQMTIRLLDQRGLTISFADVVVPPAAHAQVQGVVADMLRESAAITERLMRGQVVPPLGMSVHEFYERMQKEGLKTPDEILGPIYASMDMRTNGFYQMVAAGSKGNAKNISNVVGCVGQITVRDKRIEAHGGGVGRTLAYFQRGDMSPAASGFVPDGYAAGLSSSGHYMASINGRDDLTNKALTTAVTGYANRKSIMALQSMVAGPLREVVAPGLAAPLYGDDGMDARQIEDVAVRTVLLGDAELRAAFGWPAAAGEAWHAAELAALAADRDQYRAVFLASEESGFADLIRPSIPLAVNVAQVALDVLGDAPGPAGEPPAPGELRRMHLMVQEFCGEVVYLLLNARQRAAGRPPPLHMTAATEMLRRVLRIELGSRRLAELRATPARLLAVFDAVRLRFLRSLVAPGEAVGVLASQAVSEPLTQYMLDSHHRSVSGGTSKSGIIRPQEIFGAQPVAREKTSEMLLRGVRRAPGGAPARTSDRALLQEIADSIKVLTLDQVSDAWDILLEPLPAAGSPAGLFYPGYAGDRAWVLEFLGNNPLLAPPADLSLWCLRVQLSRLGLMVKSITLEAVAARLRLMCPFAYFVHSPEGRTPGSPSPVLRVYLRTLVFGKTAFAPDIRAAIKAALARVQRGNREADERVAEGTFLGILRAPLRGVPGVRDARVEKVTRHRVAPGGRLERATDEYAIRTSGTNLAGVLMYEAVEASSAVTSSIGDTIAVLGIEAGRLRIIKELARVMGSRAPSLRHLHVYADQMTRTGQFTSLEHGGIRKREYSNVLLRAANHGPLAVLTQAPLENQVNHLYGMAGPMVMGDVPRVGTSLVRLAVDEEFVVQHRKSTRSILMDL